MSEAKDADVDRLTREEIENIRRNGVHAIRFSERTYKVIELCDLALSALSQEAVRNEVLNILLWCPHCGEQHVDAPDEERGWANPPHKTHECQFCGHLWRPSDQPTNGVLTITTKGKADGNPKPRYFATAADFDAALKREPNATGENDGK